MARHPWLDPSPFWLPGGTTGILLIHGFTGSPIEMRGLGEYLAGHGYTVSGPLLPGHGTEPAALNRVRWQDWAQTVAKAYAELAGQVRQVFVSGLSLGGLLALHLATDQPAIKGLLLYAPGLQVADRRLPLTVVGRYLVPLLPRNQQADAGLVDVTAFDRIWFYESVPVGGASQLWRMQRVTRRALHKVTQPVILFQGKLDQLIRPGSPHAILKGVASTDTRLVWLPHSGHNLLVDAEHKDVFSASLAWIQEREA